MNKKTNPKLETKPTKSTKPTGNTQTNKPASTSPAAGKEDSAKKLAQISIAISILSASFAGWSAYETREARLDSARVRMTALTQQTLSEARVALSYYKCFQTILGSSSPLIEHQKAENLIKELEPKVRESMTKFKDWGADELAIWENELTKSGSISDAVKTGMLETRANWSKDQLDKIDAICKL